MDHAQLNLEAVPFVIGVFSIVSMLVLSAIGATVGGVKSASSAAVVANRGSDLITKAYIPVLLASAGFMYAIIVTCVAVTQLKTDIKINTAWNLMGACLTYGIGGLFSGLAIGKINKYAIVKMSENRDIFFSLIIINSTVEIPAVFALICAIVTLSQK